MHDKIQVVQVLRAADETKERSQKAQRIRSRAGLSIQQNGSDGTEKSMTNWAILILSVLILAGVIRNLLAVNKDLKRLQKLYEDEKDSSQM